MEWFNNWWNTLGLFEQIMYCVAIPSTLILLIQTIMLILGFGHSGAGVNPSDTSGFDGSPDMGFDGGTDGELGWAGVGQHNDLVNPCAVLTMMGAIASDDAVRPRLVAKETSMSGLSLLSGERTERFAVWKASTRQILREMLRNDVTAEYGQEMFGELAVCAKSGTAEVGGGQTPHAWFAGFLDDPAHPLAFVVLVENGGFGVSAAGSIAAQVLQAATAESGE